VPGEQPKIKGLIKLNTNENPYAPSPNVLAVIKKAVDGRLRLYPPPASHALREKLAELHGCGPESVIIGNGSDELLSLATRAFVEPSAVVNKNQSRSTIQFFSPSYSLYPVLTAIHGALGKPVPLKHDFSLPAMSELRRAGIWDFRAALTFITTPNAPSGRGFPTEQLAAICQMQRGVVVLDEAYVDFANENALALALKNPNVLVARTFSKAYSLCFQRVGYFVGHPELIAGLDKLRDSYNVNGLGQIAAIATLDNLPYYQANFRRIIATRQRLSDELARLGFDVLPSQANFILTRPPCFPAKGWFRSLRERRILVRWFDDPEVNDYLRITIGSESEASALLQAIEAILKTGSSAG
jgi:histidinol-phosphate aminotransferase